MTAPKICEVTVGMQTQMENASPIILITCAEPQSPMRNKYAKMGIHRQPATTSPDMSSGTPLLPSPMASNPARGVAVARNRKRNHPLHCEMETTRVDGVKAPQHFKTPRSHLHHPRELVDVTRVSKALREDEVHVALHGVAEDGGVAVAVALEHVYEINTHVRQFVDFAGHVLD